jgi:hypothetical protein
MDQDFLIKIRADADLQKADETIVELRQMERVAREAGLSTKDYSDAIEELKRAVGDRVLDNYRQHLQDSIRDAQAAGQATDVLRAKLALLDTAQPRDRLSTAVTAAAQDIVNTIPGVRAFSAELNGAFPLIGAAGVAGAAGVGLLQTKIREAIALADQLNNSAENLGITTTSLQTIANAAQTSGINFGRVDNALDQLNRRAQEAVRDNGAARESFAALGVTVDELRTLAPDQLFLRIADAIRSTQNPGDAYLRMTQLMGRGSGEFFALLSKGREEIQKLGEDMGTFSEDTVRRLEEVNRSLDRYSTIATVILGGRFADFLTGIEAMVTAPVTSIVMALREAGAAGLIPDSVVRALADATGELETLERLANPAAKAVREVNRSLGEMPDAELEAKKRLDEVKTSADQAKDAVDRLADATKQLQTIETRIAEARDAAEKAQIKRDVDSGVISREEGAKRTHEVETRGLKRRDESEMRQMDAQIAEAERRVEANKAAAAARFATTHKLDAEGRAAIDQTDVIGQELARLKQAREALVALQGVRREDFAAGGAFGVEQAAQQDAAAQARAAQDAAREKERLQREQEPSSPEEQAQGVARGAAGAVAGFTGRSTFAGRAGNRIREASAALQQDGVQPGELEELEAAIGEFLTTARNVNQSTREELERFKSKVMALLAGDRTKK